jgi:hypothetical protein
MGLFQKDVGAAPWSYALKLVSVHRTRKKTQLQKQ